MKQEEFFKLLDRRLSIIEDGERQDILDEYRQHIAMKIKEDNISEEDALADFGDVDSFADEILSAYHVRAGASPDEKQISGKNRLSKIKGTASNVWTKIRTFFSQCGKGISRFFTGCNAKIRILFPREKNDKIPKPVHQGGTIWRRLFAWIGFAVRTVLRWCRNILFGGLGLIFAAIAAISLVVFGACIVVVTQGYPLIGASVLLLGLLLCSSSIAILFYGMIRCRHVASGKKEETNHAEE